MKNRKRSLTAFILAVSMVVGSMPGYVKAEDTVTAASETEAPVIGNCVNLANSHEELIGEQRFESNAVGPVDLSADVEGDTWYVSTIVSLNEISGIYAMPELAFARGAVNNTNSAVGDMISADMNLRLGIRQGADNQGEYVLMCASGQMWNHYDTEDGSGVKGKVLKSGRTGVPLNTGEEYLVTIKVSDKDLVSFWLNGKEILHEISLEELGVTSLEPSVGWRCYGVSGSFKDIRVWDGVTDSDPEYLIGSYANLIHEKDVTFASGGNRDATDLSGVVQGNTWCISTTLNYTSISTRSAPEIAFAKGTYQGQKNMLIRLQIRNTDNNQGQYVLNCALEPMHTYADATKAGATGVFLETGKDYQITMKVINGDLLKFWINGVFVTEFSLAGLGITNLRPCLGWRAYNATGVIKNIQVWDEVTKKPVFNEKKDQNAASVTEIVANAPDSVVMTDLENVLYGSSGTYYFSGTVNGENAVYWGSMRFLVAERQIDSGETEKINVCLRPGIHNQIVVFSNGTSAGEQALSVGQLPDGVSVGDTYTYTVAYENGTISFYVDDVLVVNRLALDGVFTPKSGVMAQACQGIVTDIRLWGDVQTNQTKPVFAEGVDSNSAMLDAVSVSSKTKRDAMLFQGIQYGNRYQYSGNVQISESGKGNCGIGMILANVVYQGESGNVEVCYQPAQKRVVLAVHTASGEKRLKVAALSDDAAASDNFSYTAIYNKGVVSFWVNDTLVISNRDLNRETFLTDLTPNAGVCASACSGTLSNVRIWGETNQTEQAFYQYFSDISSWRTSGTYTSPVASGYLFAGWYQDEKGTKAVAKSTTSGSAYAKFVPEKVLTVKAQLKAGTTLGTEKTDIRFITTVDTLRYQEIGYDISFAGGRTRRCSGTEVYKTILGLDGLASVRYTPELFHPCSTYFYAFNIRNIPNTVFSTEITVSPYWITLDGTEITGKVRTLQVKDGCPSSDATSPILEVFHDPANEYISPLEPSTTDNITLRVRTERNNVTEARIEYTNDNGSTWNTAAMSFECVDETGYYDFFVGTIPAQSSLFYYRFVCSNGSYTVYLDRKLTPSVSGSSYTNCWVVNPGYSTPDWSKGALWYSLVPDSFYNGDTSNDVTVSDVYKVNSWNNDRLGLTDKYGGDLAGITEKTEYLKSLNVDAVYMNPIFKSNQNLGYGQVDFMQVDSSYGNAETLAKLCDTLEQNQLKVMMDAVLTFSPWDSLYLDSGSRYPLDGAEESESSVYSELYIKGTDSKYEDSGWNGPTINLSSEIAKSLFYTQAHSFLRYYPEHFGIDGWRFDCGGAMKGVKADGTNVGSAQIMADMRSYLKADNQDILLVSEYSGDEALMGDSWDSRWNDYYSESIRGYANGEISAADISVRLKTTINKFPRPVALSMYNLATSHDKKRLNISESYMEKAMILLQMNYLGSPCIYYGDEIGLSDASSTTAMNWDESTWDYEKYDFYRALGELRSSYSAVKTGAIRDLLVSNQKNLYAFGRWDDKGTVVTVASQNDSTMSVDLNVRKISVPDGTIFTDWLTGKQYCTDENGILHVDVAAGGSVFVTGTQSSSYRQEYEITNLGDASGKIVLGEDGSYTLSGKGTLSSSDVLSLASGQVFGAGAVSGILSGSGKAMLTMRQSEDPEAASYNVTVSGDQLQVVVRKATGEQMETLCTVNGIKGKAVRIERTADNSFHTSVASVSYSGKLGRWTTVSGSETVISAGRSMVAGFAPISGTTKLTTVSVESNPDDVLYDKFDSGNGSALLEGRYTIKDGQLVLDGSQKMVTAVTEGKSDDWTFRSKLLSSVKTEGTYAGVLCEGGSSQYVAAGRTVKDGKSVLFLGRTTDGAICEDAYVEDIQPDDPVILQIQRTGTCYTAVYSYNGESWSTIGDSIFANYSEERPGVFADGTTAAFEEAGFGDSIKDGGSVNTPHFEGLADMYYSTNVAAVTRESIELLRGTCEYGEEGYHVSADAHLAVTKKMYEGVRVNVTLKPEAGNGYASVGFGKKSYSSADTDGYLLSYTSAGKLSLMKDGVVLQEVSQAPTADGELRIVLEAKDGDICVYAGEKASCVIRAANTGYTEGYLAFTTSGVPAGFLNYRISSLDANWNILSGTVTGGANSITCKGTGTSNGVVTRMGIGVTDFVATASISLGSQSDVVGPQAEGGILFCAPEGASAKQNGISVSLVSGGTLRLKADGTTVGEYQLGADVTRAKLLITRKDSQIQVYVMGTTEAVLSYTDSCNRGGAIQLYSVNTSTVFANLGLEDITGKGPSEASLSKDWSNKILPESEKEYSEDFETVDAWKHLTRYATDHGTWDIQNGMLSCVSAEKYIAGVTVYDSIYQNFEMEFDFKYDVVPAEGSWGYVSFRKTSVDQSHLDPCFALLVSYNGTMTLLYEGGVCAQGSAANFKVGEWNRIKIRCKNATIQVSCVNDGVQKTLFTYIDPNSDSHSADGFISFASNQSLYSVDNIAITPLP